MRNFRFASFKVISKMQLNSSREEIRLCCSAFCTMPLFSLPFEPFDTGCVPCALEALHQRLGSCRWMMNAIKRARGVGFSVLGLGRGSASLGGVTKSSPGWGKQLGAIIYLFIVPPSQPCHVPHTTKSSPRSRGAVGRKFPKKCCNKKKGEETSEIHWSWKLSM